MASSPFELIVDRKITLSKICVPGRGSKSKIQNLKSKIELCVFT
jgi:hypothetical protein